MLDATDLKHLLEAYVIPWGINLVLALVILLLGRWLVGIVVRVAESLMSRARLDPMLVNFIGSIAKAVLMLFVVIAALDRLGVDTTSMVALLGAAGLAVGLALQGSLKNFSAGVMLIVFRPFKQGDFVEAGGIMGVVEKIAIFSTTLRTPDNREIIVPNGQIYDTPITNYSARETRRVDMTFGIAYDADLRRAKEILADILAQDPRVLKDPAPVIALGELADSSVNLLVRPWVKTPDYWDVLWDTNEKVKLRFDEAGIGIPFPQMDVHLFPQAGAEAEAVREAS